VKKKTEEQAEQPATAEPAEVKVIQTKTGPKQFPVRRSSPKTKTPKVKTESTEETGGYLALFIVGGLAIGGLTILGAHLLMGSTNRAA